MATRKKVLLKIIILGDSGVLLRPKTGFIMVSLFKFLQLKGKKMMKEDFARENITAIVHALLKPVNKVEIIGETFDGKASWCIEMLRLA